MAQLRNGESSEWQTLRIFGMADLWNGEVYRPVPATALYNPLLSPSPGQLSAGGPVLYKMCFVTR